MPYSQPSSYASYSAVLCYHVLVGISVNVLSINAGSSTIKVELFTVDPTNDDFKSLLSESRQTTSANITAVVSELLDLVTTNLPAGGLSAIGHRLVFGGPNYNQPQLITESLIKELDSLTDLDPEHMPAALRLVEIMQQRFPDTPQVACFDTAFFHDLPRVAQLLPLPRKYLSQGLRRYGFHGISYDYLLSAFRKIAGVEAARGNIIFAHLGSGASLAAVQGGKPIDTTMGFTPSSGIMMATRTGDLDPNIVGYLKRQKNMSIDDFSHMVNFESGWLGVSELSADMYSLLENESTNAQADEAINLFVYQVKKTIGAMAAALGGLNSLVFSGGIGEQSSVLRARICEGLGFLGVELDENSNNQQLELISAAHSQVGVHVIPTNEASVIVRQTYKIISKAA